MNYIHQMFRELNKMPAKESKSAYGKRPANTKEPQRDNFNVFAPQKRPFERKPYRNFNVFLFCHRSVACRHIIRMTHFILGVLALFFLLLTSMNIECTAKACQYRCCTHFILFINNINADTHTHWGVS